MDAISDLAKMFKERENILYPGPQIGKIINPPPEIRVRIGDRIVLTSEHLIISAHVLDNYERNFEMQNPLVNGLTNAAAVGDHGTHTHNIATINLSGSLRYVDTLKNGDEVILIPASDGQRYFLIDKAVRL